ncbi:unnamed protein product [Enterobius vermicularis]|uniref:Leucine rich repeat protein n=1 Tax=Enterobius vermicularis TaxID=51028 RepID=A0A0N4VE32_ENTVE|nr:unnamed protein product [Enterobius vermicularis]
MKNLRILDLGSGHNRLSKVVLRALDSLEKLYINNNSIQSLSNVSLRGLRNLNVLYLDRNCITQIMSGDLHSLGESGRYVIYF